LAYALIVDMRFSVKWMTESAFPDIVIMDMYL